MSIVLCSLFIDEQRTTSDTEAAIIHSVSTLCAEANCMRLTDASQQLFKYRRNMDEAYIAEYERCDKQSYGENWVGF